MGSAFLSWACLACVVCARRKHTLFERLQIGQSSDISHSGDVILISQPFAKNNPSQGELSVNSASHLLMTADSLRTTNPTAAFHFSPHAAIPFLAGGGSRPQKVAAATFAMKARHKQNGQSMSQKEKPKQRKLKSIPSQPEKVIQGNLKDRGVNSPPSRESHNRESHGRGSLRSSRPQQRKPHSPPSQSLQGVIPAHSGLPNITLLFTSSADAAAKFIEGWKGERHFGLDMEWKPIFRRGKHSRSAILQICAGDRVLAFDLTAIRTAVPEPLPAVLSSFLENEQHYFYGMGLEEDAARLAFEYDCVINGVDFVHGRAWPKLIKFGGGLTGLANEVLKARVKQSKRISRSNWDARPLTNTQLQYIAEDAYMSWAVANHFLKSESPRKEWLITTAELYRRGSIIRQNAHQVLHPFHDWREAKITLKQLKKDKILQMAARMDAKMDEAKIAAQQIKRDEVLQMTTQTDAQMDANITGNNAGLGSQMSKEEHAMNLKKRGELQVAEELMREVLEEKAKSVGLDDPSYFISKGNLALILRANGDFQGAEELQREVVKFLGRTRGLDHPVTLAIKEHLSNTLQASGDLEGMEALQQDILEAKIRTLGPNHLSTMSTKSNLALMMKARGNLHAAKELLSEIVDFKIRSCGRGHESTIGSKKALDRVLQELEKRNHDLKATVE